MKRRSFFKLKKNGGTSNIRLAYTEIKNEFQPVIRKGKVLLDKCIKRHPKKMMAIMLILPVINFLGLYFFTDAFKSGKGLRLSDIHITRPGIDTGEALPQIAFSFSNLKKVKTLKDTLQYLMSLQKMTFDDTLIFVRVMDQFNELTSGKDKSIPVITVEQIRSPTMVEASSILIKSKSIPHEN
ncbi:hypothetical protein [Arachidicoccus soli]|uniref:Uncharacterized protein n=1 Tax=Arachidicoccus soli TaxID=2341117 RepID=A0A386HTM8_9BACT|nr:hypothetical protein [Arachidicoccus soli]AYD49032.1 hypothetical protein D6B99_16265 [Arachidicoccus soli]